MLIKWKIIEITSNKNWYYIFKFIPLEEFNKEIPLWWINNVWTYCVALWNSKTKFKNEIQFLWNEILK